MALVDYYDRAINWPGRTGLIVGLNAGVFILCAAALFLVIGKFRRTAWGLGIVGLVAIMAVLWAVHEQTVTEKQSPRITTTTMVFSQRVRQATEVALVALPACAAAVVSLVIMSTRRRLRAQVPRYLKEGRRHLVNKEYAAALRAYNQAIENAPELAEAYFRRGSVLQAMGDSTHALEDFDRAIVHDARLAPAYLERGKIHTENGDLDRALADFEQIMQLRANDAESYLHRGICLVKKGLLNDAANDLQLVLKLTNHTDFAEPAKKYLRECEGQSAPGMPAFDANGSAGARALPQTKAEELKS